MSTLKVIACTFSEQRHVRLDVKYPDHNQDILTWEEHKNMFQTIIDLELSQDAGVPLDTLIVCNNQCKGFFDKYHNMPTKNGKIIVRYRDNLGGSFGAYSYAYENFKYDYYIFIEDDLLVFGDKYAEKLLQTYTDKQIDFLALIGVTDGVRYPRHAHGGVGLVRREILDAIAVKGKLPYFKGEWQRMHVIIDGEIELTQRMIEKRFSVEYLGKLEWSRDNFIIPYFDYVHTA